MKKSILSLALFISLQTVAFGQGSSQVLDDAVSKIQTTITDHIIEKVFLHFDRPYPYYVAGETIYFKAYATMGELHEPSRISGVLHVDLIDHNNALLQTRAIQLVNGVGWGDLSLPDSLQKGNYRIRAYTNYMRNNDRAYFFERYISVSSVNAVDKVMAATKKSGAPSLQFFPEGGNFIDDIRTKIAFKAVGPDGLGVDLKGTVVDNENNEVAKITSSHFGMGVFDFIPEEGKKYSAKVTYANGSTATVSLPQAAAKGIVLAVNTNDPSKLSIEIRANRAYYKENMNKEINLLVYWSGSVKKVNTKLDNQILGLDLPTADMMTGIVQITLFSDTGEPLSERLAFVQNKDILNLSLNSDKQVYARRENVMLNLGAKNKDGAPAKGSFSVSVVDEGKLAVDENATHNILTDMLLTPDLKGHIEKPNYYFMSNTPETRGNLDALMLTQGYRRFVWKELMNEKIDTVITYKPERTFNISGTVKTKSGEPRASVQVTLLPGAGAVKSAMTDANGHFVFADMVFETGASFILKTDSRSGKNASVITLDNPKPGAAIDPANPMLSAYNGNADILASLQNAGQGAGMTSGGNSRTFIKNSSKEDRSKSGESYRSSNLGGPGHADQVIHGSSFENAPSLVTALNGVARDIDFRNGVPYLKTGMVLNTSNEIVNPMLIIVDGVQGVKDIDGILPRTVETVEILKGPNAAIYGVAGGAGVMVITTRQNLADDGPVSKEMSPGVYSFHPVGFYKAKEFYSPQYNVSGAASLPDTRTTIFWSPNVVTDVDGKASLSFFNADGTGNYRVEVNGMDDKGNLGHQVYHYKVQ